MLRRRLNDLIQQRAARLTDAETALTAENHADYDSAMTQVNNLNTEIQRIQNLITEQDRQMLNAPAPRGSEAEDMAAERGASLLRGDAINFTSLEIRRALSNQITLGSGQLVEPTGAGSTIHDGHNGVVSSIVDQVRVEDLTGYSGWQEPYVQADSVANAGKLDALSGTARAASDPTFRVAAIKPYEVNVTTFIDRHAPNVNPARYYEKAQQIAMRALRRKVAALIVNGDGQSSPVMFGLLNAKNTKGEAIFATKALGSALGVNSLDDLYFAYGSDDACGAAARLLLTKTNLKAIGQLRGTQEKQRLFKITPDMNNANTGVISDGGLILPYTLIHDIGDKTLGYGDLQNYMLALFGGYSIRLDESVKAVERMNTILGDVFVGGNLTVDKGFVAGTISGT